MLLVSKEKFYFHDDADKLHFIAHGRGLDFLHSIIKEKSLKSEFIVLLPNYICIDVINFFLEVGASINYYDVSEKLTPVNIVEKHCDVLYTVNYFGICTESKAFQNIIKSYSPIVIEDCAQCMPYVKRMYSNNSIQYYSLRKISVNLNGWISTTNPLVNFAAEDYSLKYSIKNGILHDLKNMVAFIVLIHRAITLNVRKKNKTNYLATDLNSPKYRIRINFDQASVRRIETYDKLYSLFSKYNSDFNIYALTKDSKPIYFPVIIRSAYDQFVLSISYALLNIQFRRCWDIECFGNKYLNTHLFVLPLVGNSIVWRSKLALKILYLLKTIRNIYKPNASY